MAYVYYKSSNNSYSKVWTWAIHVTDPELVSWIMRYWTWRWVKIS